MMKNSESCASRLARLTALLLAAALLAALFAGCGKKNDPPAAETTGQPTEEPASSEIEPAAEQPAASVSYTHDDPAFFDDALLSAVVATCGDLELTNRMLAYYYWREFYSIVSTYGSYISYMMDPYGRLDEQFVSEGFTWDQMLMDYGIDSFSIVAAAEKAGREAGFTLSEKDQATLDNLEQTLTDSAARYGYSSADAYLQFNFGPYASLESYREYMEHFLYSSAYMSAKTDEIEITDQMLSDYYDEHAADYQANRLQKLDLSNVNVRHILIIPEDVTLAADDPGYEAAVKEAHDAAKEQAEAIYQQWLEGEATEESFASLAGEHSADPGSASNGGLYTDVYPGQMVPTFNDWCFDETRQIGDHGIVETDYGFHIMFFSGHTDTVYWKTVVETDCRNDQYVKLCDTLREETPATTDLSKAAVYPCNTNSAQ